jgi:hypothetical protein
MLPLVAHQGPRLPGSGAKRQAGRAGSVRTTATRYCPVNTGGDRVSEVAQAVVMHVSAPVIPCVNRAYRGGLPETGPSASPEVSPTRVMALGDCGASAAAPTPAGDVGAGVS